VHLNLHRLRRLLLDAPVNRFAQCGRWKEAQNLNLMN
jgi:hypothetical protein